MLSPNEVIEQSKSAMRQWENKWRDHAKQNGEIYRKGGRSLKELVDIGLGRTVLCVGYGPSLERDIGVIVRAKAAGKDFDIFCVDKAFAKLNEYKIKPTFVIAEDANINYEKYVEPWLEETKHTTLIMNVNSNPKWARHWKGKIYFHVNMDNIHTEKIFCEVSGCPDTIPASSNVGNSVVVVATTIMHYDKYLLLGYDSCWAQDDNYYAFEDNVKRYWMNHITMVDKVGRLVNTSSNLWFSIRWLNDFFKVVPLAKILDCSLWGLCMAQNADLERQLFMVAPRELSPEEKQKQKQNQIREMIILPQDFEHAARNFLPTVNIQNFAIRYIPRG